MLVLLLLASVSLLVLLSRTLRRGRQLSVHDGLTGAYNRRHFDECARIEFARPPLIRRAGSADDRYRLLQTIGALAVSAQQWLDLEEAYRRADAALYRAKEKGRDRVEIVAPCR